MSASEDTPLLADSGATLAGNDYDAVQKHNEIYDRFPPASKRLFVGMTAFTALMALFVSGTFIPSIPEIAKDLDTTPDVVSMAVSLSMFCVALGSMTFSSYSTYYGRRPIYLVGLPLLCAGSFGVAWAHNLTELFGWRVIQALGASPGFSVGSGVIGDIYKLEERGFAMGVFTGAALLGPALAPVAGGWAAHYSSWRHMQEAIGVAAFVAFVIMYFSLVETKHPNTKGIEKARLKAQEEGRKPPRFVFLNPIGPMALLRSPVMLLSCIAGYTALVSDFVLLIPIAYTIGTRYHLDNPFLIGLCFIPMGAGNFIGAPLAGKYSDHMVVKWRARRNGVWYPEDRMRATTSGLGLLIPLTLIACGLTTQFVPGPLGLTLNLIWFFFNGIGIDVVLSPVGSYCVDIMHENSAEAVSANQGFRALLCALTIPCIFPLIDSIGLIPLHLIFAGVAWIGYGFTVWLIRDGDRLRAFGNFKYTDAAHT
ncbi:major facilitator superfamily domain-containing protein [Schizophyllum amplum]|uniref:Major facilitator superfamily domain-containing protein n=1 Tax=Schizophyllum amplum TaxID=97359 RepID=A0A550CQX9_9AGAR|nr:major facilitator superfamily domain-containing protein [Auriculariopsis ampla]